MDLPIERRLDALPQVAQRKLLAILDSIPDAKDLIIDPLIMKPLQRFTGIKALRSHGIDKVYKLEGQIPVTNMKRVFLLYSEYQKVRQVLEQIQAELRQHEEKSISPHLILVTGTMSPTAVNQFIEHEALSGLVATHYVNLGLVKLDKGLWSLEMPTAFKNLYIQSDVAFVRPIAKALWSLQLVLGRPKLLWSQGGMAAKVVHMMERMPLPKDTSKSNEGTLGCLAIVSRDLDWPTMLLTPVTYTALLHQIIGSHCGNVKLLKEAGATSAPEGIFLSSTSDLIYNHIKNLHFSSVFPYLSTKTKELQVEAAKISRTSSPLEMKAYVKEKLLKTAGIKKALAQHIVACESVVKRVGSSFESIQSAETMILSGRKLATAHIEELLGLRQLSLSQSIRMLVLMSVMGLSEDSNQMLGQFLLSHGHGHLSAMHSMEMMGPLLDDSTAPTIVDRVTQVVARKSASVQVVDKKLKVLFPDGEISSDNKALPAQNMSSVFGGAYLPVIGRILEWMIKGEPFIQIQDALKVLPGPTMWRGSRGEYLPRPASLPTKPMKTYIVFFIGGVTYAEVAALQILEAMTDTIIVVATTSMISKKELSQACWLY